MGEEILAEGSGPVAVEAAPEPAPKKKGKRGKKAAPVSEAADSEPADSEPAVDSDAAADSDEAADSVAASEGDDVPAIDAAMFADDGDAVAEARDDGDEASDDDVAAEASDDAGVLEAAPANDAVRRAADRDVPDADDDDDSSDGDDSIAEGEGTTALPVSAASMDDGQLKLLVEALVFASDKPLTLQRLRQLTRVADIPRLEAALLAVQADYEHRGMILTSVSGGWQFRTQPQFSAWVQQLIAGRPVRLSRAQLETLAIIAYRQPITRPEIDDIRGVDSSATLKLLMDRSLIRILGKREEVGRPMLYGTTKDFLDFFSLGDLRELPTLREYSELTEESRKVMSDRLGIPADAVPGRDQIAGANLENFDPDAVPEGDVLAEGSAPTETELAADAADETVGDEPAASTEDDGDLLETAEATEAALAAVDAALDVVDAAVGAVDAAVDAVDDAVDAAVDAADERMADDASLADAADAAADALAADAADSLAADALAADDGDSASIETIDATDGLDTGDIDTLSSVAARVLADVDDTDPSDVEGIDASSVDLAGGATLTDDTTDHEDRDRDPSTDDTNED